MKPLRTELRGNQVIAARHVGDAKRTLAQLHNLQENGSDLVCMHSQLSDGTNIKVHTNVEGMDVAVIESGGGGGWSLVKEDKATKIVPIVELSLYQSGYCDGYVAFDVSEDKNEWKEIGWTDEPGTNLTNDKGVGGDILGLDNDETFRNGWCKFSVGALEEYQGEDFKTVTEITIEQLPRIDQGVNAYSGDNATSIWENNEGPFVDTNYCEIVPDPGPIPQDLWHAVFPSITYNWSMCCTNASYCGIPGLFLTVSTDSVCGISHLIRQSVSWPPLFMQRYRYTSNESWNEWIQADTGPDVGYRMSPIFSNGWLSDYMVNVFGNVWPIYTEDINVSGEVPFLAPTPSHIQTRWGDAQAWTAGVYVPNHPDMAIACVIMYEGRNSVTTGWQVSRRRYRDPDFYFVDGPGIPGPTAEQILVLAGNEEYPYSPSFEVGPTVDPYNCSTVLWNSSPYPPDHVGESFTTGEPTNAVLYVEGVRYFVAAETITPYDYTDSGIHNTGYYYNIGSYTDYGVFSSVSPIKYEKPVYVYEYLGYLPPELSSVSTTITYGIIIEGKQYQSETYPATFDMPTHVLDHEYKGKNGTLVMSEYLRAALKTITIKTYQRIV